MEKEEHPAPRSVRWKYACLTRERSRSEGGRSRSHCALGIPGHDGHGSQDTMDPADELQTRVASIQTDDPRANIIEIHGPLQERPGKGSIMHMSRREEEEHRQA